MTLRLAVPEKMIASVDAQFFRPLRLARFRFIPHSGRSAAKQVIRPRAHNPSVK